MHASPDAVAKEIDRVSGSPLLENITMSGISGSVSGDATITLIAKMLGDLHLKNTQSMSIQQVQQVSVESGIFLTKESLEFIIRRMKTIQGLALNLGELQQRLLSNWKLPVLKMETSYINLSIINFDKYRFDKYRKKQKQLKNVNDELGALNYEVFGHKTFISVSDLFKKHSGATEAPKRLIVFGLAGIGKSILCQYLARTWHQEVVGNFGKPSSLSSSLETKTSAEKEALPWLNQFKAVFWLRLREIPKLLEDPRNDGSLENIINLCFYRGKENQETLEKSLEEHKDVCLFILDGYDEIADKLNIDNDDIFSPRLFAMWETLKTQPNVILTSRPTNLDQLWCEDKTVRTLEVMGFSNEQIKKYVGNFMREPIEIPSSSAFKLLKRLKSNPIIWGIAHIPLNLKILCCLYREGKFKKKRVETLSILYEEIIENIVWLMSKKHKDILKKFDDTVPVNITAKLIALRFLEHLAYRGMLKNELLLSEKTIRLAAQQIFRTYNIDYEKRLIEKLLVACHQLGFLFSNGHGGESIVDQAHYFIPLSFQAYFGARYVSSLTKKSEEHKEKLEDIQQIIEEYNSPRYQLMRRFAVGLLKTKQEERSMEIPSASTLSPIMRISPLLLSPAAQLSQGFSTSSLKRLPPTQGSMKNRVGSTSSFIPSTTPK